MLVSYFWGLLWPLVFIINIFLEAEVVAILARHHCVIASAADAFREDVAFQEVSLRHFCSLVELTILRIL